jgi:hypothetical protein
LFTSPGGRQQDQRAELGRHIQSLFTGRQQLLGQQVVGGRRLCPFSGRNRPRRIIGPSGGWVLQGDLQAHGPSSVALPRVAKVTSAKNLNRCPYFGGQRLPRPAPSA